MSVKLFFQAIIKYLCGIIMVGALLFISAGTFDYFNGWLFMGLLFVPMFFAGTIMMIKNPSLLKSRLDVKEKEMAQKKVVALSGIMFFLGFILAGLDYRFNITNLSNTIVLIASIIFLISYLMYAEILHENTYLARTIKVEKNQKVIDTGFYKIVRHPMYLATIFLFLSMPLILGSLISLIVFLSYPFIIIQRIKNEEEVLTKSLKGYEEYQKEVKYCLIPYIW